MAAHLNYTYQEGEGGIADALGLAAHFAKGEKICVILGDNIVVEKASAVAVEDFRKQNQWREDSVERSDGTRSVLAWLSFQAIGLSALRKSLHPKSSYAVTGIYLYDEIGVGQGRHAEAIGSEANSKLRTSTTRTSPKAP